MKRLLVITVATGMVIVVMIGVVILASSVVERYSEQYHFRKSGGNSGTETTSAVSIPDRDAMVRIPGGAFVMGADLTGREPVANRDESPPHRVSLPPFYIGKYEVTHLQYKKFVDATGHPPPLRWEKGAYPPGKADHPVIYVNLEDAKAYAAWAGGRLCTEAEWELAAKGFDRREWPWGNRWDDRKANVYYTVGDTTPVNGYPQGASPFGVLGMADNVWEWVSDPYRRYPGNTDPEWYFQRGFYLLRSGSWKSDFLSSRTTTRNPTNPVYRADYFGIRICKDATSGKKTTPREAKDLK